MHITLFHRQFWGSLITAWFILYQPTDRNWNLLVKTLKRWTNETNETEWVLQACLDLTEWSVFEAAANYLDDLTETFTSYISFCEYMCIPTRTHLTYNSDKPRFTAKLRQLRQAKENAYRKGDIVLYKQAKYTLEKEIRVAKRNYSNKLRTQFSSSDSASVWKGLKVITNYKTPSPSTVENQKSGRQSEWVLLQIWKNFMRSPPALPTLTAWTALWLQSHSGSWAPTSPKTWSRTIT